VKHCVTTLTAGVFSYMILIFMTIMKSDMSITVLYHGMFLTVLYPVKSSILSITSPKSQY